jgi:hypothetical protein
MPRRAQTGRPGLRSLSSGTAAWAAMPFALITVAAPAPANWRPPCGPVRRAALRPIQHRRVGGTHTGARSLRHRFDAYSSSSQPLLISIVLRVYDLRRGRVNTESNNLSLISQTEISASLSAQAWTEPMMGESGKGERMTFGGPERIERQVDNAQGESIIGIRPALAPPDCRRVVSESRLSTAGFEQRSSCHGGTLVGQIEDLCP